MGRGGPAPYYTVFLGRGKGFIAVDERDRLA